MAQTFASILERLYPDGIAHAAYTQGMTDTFLQLVKKNSRGFGSGFDVLVVPSLGPSRSADFQTSRRNKGNGNSVRFRLDYKNDYSNVVVDAKDWTASKGEGTTTELLSLQMDNAMENIRNSIAQGCAGDGSGAQCRISAINASPAYFEVADPRDLRYIDVDHVLESSATRTGGTKRAGTAVVTRVVKDIGAAGRVYYTAVSGWAPVVNDWVYMEGDKDSKIQGVAAWIPTTAPQPGDNFGGVDRSVNPTALAGLRISQITSPTHEEALVRAMEGFRNFGASPTHVFMNPRNFSQLESELTTRKRIVNLENDYNVGITGIEMANGGVIVQDPNFAVGFAYALTLKDWELMSMKEAPHLENEDHVKLLRMDDADAFEARLRAWVNLKCNNPAKSGVIFLPAI